MIVPCLWCALLFAWWFTVIDDGCWCHTITDGGEALVIGGLGLLGVTGWFGGVIILDSDPHLDLLRLRGKHRYVVVVTICGHSDFVTLGDAHALDGHFDVFLAITITHNQIGTGVGGTCDGGCTFGLIEANVAGSFFINSQILDRDHIAGPKRRDINRFIGCASDADRADHICRHRNHRHAQL